MQTTEYEEGASVGRWKRVKTRSDENIAAEEKVGAAEVMRIVDNWLPLHAH